MTARPAPRRLHYAWVVAAVTFLTLLATAGVRSTPGVLMIPLEREFGWDRATVSLAVSINLFLFGLCGPFAAALMERFGLRRVVVSALLVLAVATATTTLMRQPWQLYLLWGVIVGTATGATATVLGAVIANRWFVARRGLVVGLLTASNATGQLVFLPLLASLTVNVNWRAAALVTTVGALIMAVVAGLLMRDRPSDIGLRPQCFSADLHIGDREITCTRCLKRHIAKRTSTGRV